MSNPAERLEYLRGEIEAERISYGEIAELQGLAEHIDPSDLLLRQWAGVPEHDEEECAIVHVHTFACLPGITPAPVDFEPATNIWGTEKSLIDADEFCVECERETPRHYDSCPLHRAQQHDDGQTSGRAQALQAQRSPWHGGA